MKIALLSDIHAEFYTSATNWLPPLPSDADVLVLGGDLHVGELVVELITRISKTLPNTHIVFVAGNHEFYGCNIDKITAFYRESFAANQQVHFLENDAVKIKGITFIGATLWTNFPVYRSGDTTQHLKVYAKDNIADFHRITIGDDNRSFTPDDAVNKCIESKAFLDRTLSASNPKKTVVITHFPPTRELASPLFPVNPLTSYFTALCDDLIAQHKPKYWFYGHNHWSDNKKVGATQFVSNQLGYPQEGLRTGDSFTEKFFLQI